MSDPSASRDLALVGAGYWGRNLARNFNALGALHTICDANPAALNTFAAGYGEVQKAGDFAEVLRNPAVNKVAIAAPAALHHGLVKRALEAGKDVFVEKPLCLGVKEAQEVVALAKASGRVLMVGHLLRYHPCVLKLLTLVAQGELGKLQYITSNRLNLGKIRSEENALWSFAPHDLSVILALAAGQLPERVRCTGEAYLTKGVADTTLTTLQFSGGVRAHIYVSWLNPFKEQKLTVVGSSGMAVFDDTKTSWNEKLLVYRHYLTWADGQIPTPNNAKAEPVAVPEAEPLREECAHFLACCLNRQIPRTDGQEGLRVLQVLQAAQASLETNGEAVEPESPGRPGQTPGRSAKSGAEPDYFAHPSAFVDDGATVGQGTKIWHFSHVMKGAKIGEHCVFGQNVNVDGGVVIGDGVEAQNNVSIYTGTTIEDDVFLGPSCVLTNVSNPRSQVVRHSLYEKTVIKRGATIGANATIVCGVVIGRHAFIGAGAVVTRDVPDYALVLGNPGRRKGWMSRHGHPLTGPSPQGVMVCPESGFRYQETRPGALKCLDLDEDAPLPPELRQGRKSYRDFKPPKPVETAR